MAKVIHCPCGYIVRAPNDETLVKNAQKHASDSHSMQLTEEQALSMARPE